MNIKNLVFDMGNVLIHYNASHYVEKYAADKADWPILLQEVFQSVEWIRMDHGTITEEEAVKACCKRLPPRLHKTAAQLYAHWNEDIPPIAGMEALIVRAKAAGYGIYLLSNTSVRYHNFRKNIPALTHFDGEFISADCHLLKPDPAIFDAFCAHFSLQPTECLFIDDLAMNVYGAQCAQMQGIVFYGDVAQLETKLKDYGVNLPAVQEVTL
ncbi:MAG: HAD family phosphatase [Oscillospiraceae bacterium]|nr:HAD family phosphatase [Oscillospiraceae bacterium]